MGEEKKQDCTKYARVDAGVWGCGDADMLPSLHQAPGCRGLTVSVLPQEDSGLRKAATDLAPGLCHVRVAWVQSGRMNDRKTRMTRMP